MNKALLLLVFLFIVVGISSQSLPHMIVGKAWNQAGVPHSTIRIRLSVQGVSYYYNWPGQTDNLPGSITTSPAFAIQTSAISGFQAPGATATLTVKGDNDAESSMEVIRSATSVTNVGDLVFTMDDTANRAALTAIYNACGGANWTNNTNWLSPLPLSEWYGVQTYSGQVTILDLSNNNLFGDLPPEVNTLTSMHVLNLSHNSLLTLCIISGLLPDCVINVSFNQLHFYSFDINVFAPGIWTRFPQNPCYYPQTINATQGATVEMHSGISGNNLTYNWTKDGAFLTTTASGNLILNDVQPGQAGFYGCSVYSNDWAAFIERHPITLTVMSVNHPPVIDMPAVLHINQNESLSFDIYQYASDPDGDTLLPSVTGNQFISAVVSSNIVTLYPSENWTGTETITIMVVDDVVGVQWWAEDTVSIVVSNPLEIDFDTDSSLNNNIVMDSPATVPVFTATCDAPYSLVSWAWDFDNDGITDSTLPNPQPQYTSTGLKDVRLTASDGIHVSSLLKPSFITVLPGEYIPPAVVDEDLIFYSNNVYNLGGELQIDTGVNLIVQPNAEVNMLTQQQLVINGNIQASGASFQASRVDEWGGIVLNSGASGSSLVNLQISGASIPLVLNDCSPFINNLVLEAEPGTRNPGPAIRINGSSAPLIQSLQTHGFATAIKAQRDGAGAVTLNIDSVLLNRGDEVPSSTDIGIEIQGDYWFEAQDIRIQGYPRGIGIQGTQPTLGRARLTGSRVVQNESNRDPGTAISIAGVGFVQIMADTLIGFDNAIVVSNGGTASSCEVSSCVISKQAYSANSVGISVSSFQSLRADSLLVSNYGTAISTDGGSSRSIGFNQLLNCGTGILTDSPTSYVQVRNNIIRRDQAYPGTQDQPALNLTSTCAEITGNTVFAHPTSLRLNGGTAATLVNNIFWPQQEGPDPIQIMGTSTLSATFNDIRQTAGVYPGTGNQNRDPRFVDPGNGNLNLGIRSRCIDAGDPGWPLDPDGSRADLGALYFDQTNMSYETDFYCDIQAGPHPLAVQFYDDSAFSASSWNWDFNGDGTIDSTLRDPLWTFEQPGSFSVSLSSSDGSNTATVTYDDLISVWNTAPEVLQPIEAQNWPEDFGLWICQLDAFFNDADGDSLSYSVALSEPLVSWEITGSDLRIHSIQDLFGALAVTVTADDGYSEARAKNGFRVECSLSFNVTIDPVNDPPELISAFPEQSLLYIAEGDEINFNLEVVDVDSPVTYIWLLDNVDQNNNGPEWNHVFDEQGYRSVSVTISDGVNSFLWGWGLQVQSSPSDDPLVPAFTALLPNTPNPFREGTSIHYAINRQGPFEMAIYNSRGQLVKRFQNCPGEAGWHHQYWNGCDSHGRKVSAGVYLVRMTHEGKSYTRKVLLVR